MLSQLCRLDAATIHDMTDLDPGCDQVVRDDAPVTLPPGGLSTHDRTGPHLGLRCQRAERLAKGWGQCIVRVVLERLDPPGRIRR